MISNVWKFLGVVVAIALIIFACQKLPFVSAPTAPTPVIVKLSSWAANPAEQKLLRQVLNDFELQHPGIKVKHEVINDQYMDVIKTRFVGEAAPDVFYLDVFEAPFLMSQDVLEPLEAYIKPEFDLADFQETLLDSFKYQNHIYGLPKDYSTLALFYNKQAFAAANLSSPPTTWDELRSDSKLLTVDRNRDGRIDQYGFGEIPELARQAYKIKAFGGQLVRENGYAAFASEAGLQGLQVAVDQYQKDRTSAQKSDVGTNSGSEMFGQGKAAMVIEGNWAIPYLTETFPKLDFATAEVPRMNDKKGTMVFTVAYVMNKLALHKAEAWELMSYLTGKEGMQKWTATGFALPTRKSVAEKLDYEKDLMRSALLPRGDAKGERRSASAERTLTRTLSPFVTGVDYAIPWQAGKYPAVIMNNFDNQFVSAMLGQQPLKQAMVRSQAEANKQIQAME